MGRGKVVGTRAINFFLYDHAGQPFDLYKALSESHILLVFYPGGRIKPVCKKQLCSYRDNFESFSRFNVKIVGVSMDKRSSLAEFALSNDYPFTFLTDPGNKIAEQYNCHSLFMAGGISRAVFIINKTGIILYSYVEPTTLTARGSEELIAVLSDLATHNLL